jgi:hypothetical protein
MISFRFIHADANEGFLSFYARVNSIPALVRSAAVNMGVQMFSST